MTRIGKSSLHPRAGLGPAPAQQDPATSATKRSSSTQKKTSTLPTQVAADVVASQQAHQLEKAQLHQFVEARSQDKAKQEAVDFGQMTQAQHYDYLRKLTIQNAAGDTSAWKQSDREINLIGVRFAKSQQNSGPGGSPYNDHIFVARTVDDHKETHCFEACLAADVENSPDDGPAFYDRDGILHSFVHLAPGFYRDAFRREAAPAKQLLLRQQGLVRLQTESPVSAQHKGARQNDPAQRRVLAGPRLQLLFCPGASPQEIGPHSTGSQVLEPSHFAAFAKLLEEAPPDQDQTGQGGMSYLLISASDLPQVDGDFSALRREQIDPRTVFQRPLVGGDLMNRKQAPRLTKKLAQSSVRAHRLAQWLLDG